MRGKWGRADYRDSTIALVLSGRSKYYQPRRPRLRGHSTISFSMEVC